MDNDIIGAEVYGLYDYDVSYYDPSGKLLGWQKMSGALNARVIEDRQKELAEERNLRPYQVKVMVEPHERENTGEDIDVSEIKFEEV